MKRAALLALLITTALTSGMLEGQAARVSLSFTTNVLDVGTPTVIDLLIDCQAESCAAADIRVRFNPAALRVDAIALGDFPTQTGSSVYLLEHQVDAASATFTLRYVSLDDGRPASAGTGTLAHITVTALADGLTELQFDRASVASLDGRTVFTPQTAVGTVLVRPVQQRHTLSVRTEAAAPDQISVIAPDASAVVSRTRVGDTLLVETNPASRPGAEVLIDAAGHLGCTTPGSEDRSITLRAGDVNNDGVIDLRDADIIGSAFDGNSEPEADVNHDGAVDIFDLIHVGRNCGLNSGECG
ncbi:MAG: hypothetical protein IT319_13000 [Anaerolineae bacterium]|nr:hypothetical protein [Anaerolineae bacterium]